MEGEACTRPLRWPGGRYGGWEGLKWSNAVYILKAGLTDVGDVWEKQRLSRQLQAFDLFAGEPVHGTETGSRKRRAGPGGELRG